MYGFPILYAVILAESGLYSYTLSLPNDLPSRVHSKVKLYANDVLLYFYIKSETGCHALQEDLDALAQWARIWQMEFNPSKCEFLRITNKKNPNVFNYCIKTVPIAQVAHTKYLGITIFKQPFME